MEDWVWIFLKEWFYEGNVKYSIEVVFVFFESNVLFERMFLVMDVV